MEDNIAIQHTTEARAYRRVTASAAYYYYTLNLLHIDRLYINIAMVGDCGKSVAGQCISSIQTVPLAGCNLAFFNTRSEGPVWRWV